MTHQDHVKLIERGIKKKSGGVWADIGSGDGAFTLALRDIAGSSTEIFSLDKNAESLKRQEKKFQNHFPETNIHFLIADFTKKLELPLLDGILAANSIHFERNTLFVIKQLVKFLKPGGSFIVVEYNVDVGNTWVPYPISFGTFKKLSYDAGLKHCELLATIPSVFLGEIYAAKAVSQK